MKTIAVIRRQIIAALPAVYFLGLALLWFRPLFPHLTDHLLNAPWWYDALLNTAQLETWSSNLLSHPAELLKGFHFYPHHDVLGFTEQMPVLSLIARLARMLGMTPIGAYNVVLLTGLFLNGWLSFLFIKKVTGAWTFGLLAGTLLETTPYFVFQSGRVQLLWLGALPLALAGVHCLALGRHQRTAMIGLALAVVLAWGSCVYYAVLLTPLIMVVIFLYATSGLVSNRLSFLIRAGSSLFLGLALMSQELWAYNRISTNFGFLRKIYLFPSSPLWRYVHLEPDRWVFWGNALAHTPAEGEKVLFPGVILLGLVAASLILLTALFFRRAAAWISALARERGKGVSLHPGSKILWPSLLILVGILGVRMFVLDHDVSLLLLAVLLACLKPGPNDASNPPAVAARALFLVALAGFVLSLGLTLEVSKTTYTLPLTWLYDLLPGFNAVRFASRWGIFAIAGMTGLVAVLGATMVAQRRRLRFGLPLVLTAFALVELWPHTFELIRIPDLIEDRPANRFLHDHPGGVLAVLPVRTAANRFTDGVCLDAVITYAAACFYHHPVLNGMSGFDPPFYEKVVMPALEAFPHIESRQLLDALGVRWLYVQGQFYEKSRFDDLVAFVGAHPENFRLAFRQDLDLVLERVGKTDMNPEDLPDNAATKMKQLPEDCTVSTAIASAEASFLVDEKVETIWSTKGPQIGHESIAVSCRQPMTIAGFVFELGGRYADYPRGLVIEYKSKDGHWVPLLVEKNALDLARLVFHPKIDRVVKTFAPTEAATWRIRQTGSSVRSPWSIAELGIVPAFLGQRK